MVHKIITPHTGRACVIESTNYFLVKHPDRVKLLGEVFTPTELVLEILDQLPIEVWDDGKTYLDPTCGNGQFLAAVLIIKQSLNHVNPLETIYGVDIMQDNVDECRQRLIDIAGDNAHNWAIVEHNILCKDGLTYDYSFDSEPPPIEQLFDW
jgi:SAM-dependent methyltransferase